MACSSKHFLLLHKIFCIHGILCPLSLVTSCVIASSCICILSVVAKEIVGNLLLKYLAKSCSICIYRSFLLYIFTKQKICARWRNTQLVASENGAGIITMQPMISFACRPVHQKVTVTKQDGCFCQFCLVYRQEITVDEFRRIANSPDYAPPPFTDYADLEWYKISLLFVVAHFSSGYSRRLVG